MPVHIPGSAIGAEDDVLLPLQELLRGIQALPAAQDQQKAGIQATFTGPPDSVAIIEAGATALSKWWSVALGALGGGATVTSAVTHFWSGQTDPAVRAALVGGTAAVIAIAILAIAMIVSADVRGRAAGMVAQYQARATVAERFISSALSAGEGKPAAQQGGGAQAVPPRVSASTSNVQVLLAAASAGAAVRHAPTDRNGHLAGVRQRVGGLTEVKYVRDDDGTTDWCPPEELQLIEFTFSPAYEAPVDHKGFLRRHRRR